VRRSLGIGTNPIAPTKSLVSLGLSAGAMSLVHVAGRWTRVRIPLSPPSSNIAVAPLRHLSLVRQLTVPRPNEPPTMNPSFFIPGTTMTHSALLTTEPVGP